MCMEKCGGGCMGHKICKILVLVGGLNWGLVGVGMLMGSDWNVVKMIFGSMPTVEAVVYVVVGLGAVMQIFGCRCKKCMAACASCGPESMDKKM
jgi:uncharacterized membrane protein YuzA (DUF378 family)